MIVLHQYAGSPFAEKVRLILGFKGLAWSAVSIPVVMPKPDLTALTGGYRRTPVLQIGADIYCDTALIARVLDALQPEPPLYPALAPLAPLLAQWADQTLFWTAVPFALQPAGAAAIFGAMPPEAQQAFAADRAAFGAGHARPHPRDAAVALEAQLGALEAQLAAGGPFLFGAAACIADFSVAHSLWFLRQAGPMAEPVARRPALSAWLDRVLGFGHGRRSKLAPADALALAAQATAHAATQVQPGLGFAAGTAVTVTPLDVGRDPVAGTLVGLSADEVVLRRTDERAGTLHVHFPRQGFALKEQR